LAAGNDGDGLRQDPFHIRVLLDDDHNDDHDDAAGSDQMKEGEVGCAYLDFLGDFVAFNRLPVACGGVHLRVHFSPALGGTTGRRAKRKMHEQKWEGETVHVDRWR